MYAARFDASSGAFAPAVRVDDGTPVPLAASLDNRWSPAILAIGATSRVLFELATKFSTAPLPYTLSAVAAVVYVLITVALVKDTPGWRRIATVAMVPMPASETSLTQMRASGLICFRS